MTSLSTLLSNVRIRPDGNDPVIIRQNFQYIKAALESLTETEHNHDSQYYTEAESDLRHWMGF